MKIVLSAIVAMFLIGCSDNSTSNAKEELSESVAQAKEAVAEKSQALVSQVKESVSEVSEKTQNVVEETVENVAEKTEAVVETTKNATVEAVASVKAVAQTTLVVDGSKIYKTCAGCHGVTAQNKALNKSQIIKGWESAKIISALNGYKDGSYGSTMKGVMKAQVSKLSDEEIKAVAEYISSL